MNQPCGEQNNSWDGYVPRHWARPVGSARIHPGKRAQSFSVCTMRWYIARMQYNGNLISFLLFLSIIHFHSPSVICVVKACFPPETSWNRDDIIYHCPRKHSDSSILLTYFQITVMSLPINCACLCQPGLVLPGKFTVSGAVTLLPCQLPASLCHLHCPWTERHRWGEAWPQLGQAQSHLSKLSGSQFSFGK